MENGKVLLCFIFNIHPIVPATVFALVMDIIAVDRPIPGLLMAATQAAEIGVILIRCHHTCAVALGAFHLNAGGEGAVGTICKVGFINYSAHASTHSFQEIAFTDETGMVSNPSLSLSDPPRSFAGPLPVPDTPQERELVPDSPYSG